MGGEGECILDFEVVALLQEWDRLSDLEPAELWLPHIPDRSLGIHTDRGLSEQFLQSYLR